VIEKPFGHSFNSACALNARILSTLHEDQIFRIDHFVGKDTVQNIMAFRFANGIFEPIWNRDRIDHVQITAAEILGVEHRGKFYEATGALRDMVPNHLMSLLSLVAMEPPTAFNAASIHSKKAEVLAAMPAVKPEHAIRGQYGAGTVMGRPVKGYREEPNVAPRSNVETYIALRLEIDNWRWAGVPFFIRTGKRLPVTQTELRLVFKRPPRLGFWPKGHNPEPNQLVVKLDPSTGIRFQVDARRTDLGRIGPIELDMEFAAEGGEGATPYEVLLHAALIGDSTRFSRQDGIEETWRVMQPLLDAPPQVHPYDPGSWGPAAADDITAGFGGWRAPWVPS
jgi:glucose-6-phosphate 1-dehydrogenase